MSNSVTVARPYAKAVFEHARVNKTLAQWSVLLNYLAQMILDPRVVSFIKNPIISSEQKTAFLTADIAPLAESESSVFTQFVELLAMRKRLLALQSIHSLYEAMREEEEKVIQVKIVSCLPPTHEQESRLIEKLKKRLNRDVSIQVEIDPSLIGGARIYAGDLVIDGSVLAKLHKLQAALGM